MVVVTNKLRRLDAMLEPTAMHRILIVLVAMLLAVALPAAAEPVGQDGGEASPGGSVDAGAGAESVSPFVAVCPDNREVVGPKLTFTNLNPEGQYRLTLFGGGTFDPALAIVRLDGSVTCSDNEGTPAGSQVGVPGAGRLDANEFSTQYAFSPAGDTGVSLVVGGMRGTSGPFALVIEGFRIDPPEATQSFFMQIPPAASREWHGLFMIAQEAELDGRIAVAQERDETFMTVFECDNAGTAGCNTVPPLTDNGAIINGDTAYVGDSFDAGYIGVPGAGTLMATLGSARGASSGGFAIIVTGTAPGDPEDPRLICNDVGQTIVGASASYNELYPPENALDGDPTTAWVSGSSTASGEQQRVFLVIGLEQPGTVSSVRVNGYVRDPALRTNSVKNFDVVVTDMNQSIVTALSAEAQLRPGYQTFNFRPAQVREVGLVFRENYGGSLFEIADIQVCGRPVPLDQLPERTPEATPEPTNEPSAEPTAEPTPEPVATLEPIVLPVTRITATPAPTEEVAATPEAVG